MISHSAEFTWVVITLNEFFLEQRFLMYQILSYDILHSILAFQNKNRHFFDKFVFFWFEKNSFASLRPMLLFKKHQNNQPYNFKNLP